MRKTKEEAELTRQRLLKAALVVFSRKGYAATRLEDIADEAGVTRGAIYHHFGNKAELYTLLVGSVSGRVQPVIEAAVKAGGGSAAILRRMFVETILYAVNDAEFRAVNELVLFKSEATAELAGGIAQKRAASRALTQYVASMAQTGIEDGTLRAGLDPMNVALGLVALQNGLLSFWLMDPDQFSLRQRVEGIVDLYMQGIEAG
jgi:TetR/AcrR family transcriptional regulator, acrAB operon repressor